MGSSFFFLFILFILFLVILVQNIRLRDKVGNLEWQILPLNRMAERLKALEDMIASLKLPEVSLKKKEETTAEPAVLEQKTDTPQAQPAAVPPPKEIQQPVYEFEIPKSRTREEWESFIGGKLLNRIGALALIFGLGFFLKYAFDNDWISESVRVLIGCAVGFLCLGFAHRTSKKGLHIFAQGLLGAGISILYLSVYASFNFYSLVPQWVAFILMSIVTLLTLAIGLYYNSLAVGVLGWAGGFLTPIMLSTGVANEIGLFTYIALLDVGLLAVVLSRKEWNVIEPLAFGGTWILYFSWYFQYYQRSDLALTIFFISVFWILFLGLDLSKLRLAAALNDPLQHVIAGLNLLIYFSVLYGLVNADYHPYMGGMTVLLAGIYIGAYLWLQRSGVSAEAVKIRFVISTIALTVAATSIQFEDFTTVMIWSAEMALLIWCGTEWKQKFITISGVIIFAFAVLKYFYTNGAFSFMPIDEFRLIFNQRCLTLAVMASAFGASALFVKKAGPEGKGLSYLFHSAWCIALFVLLTVETNDYFELNMRGSQFDAIGHLQLLRPLVLAAVWSLFSVTLTFISLRNNITPLLVSGMCILVISSCFIIVRAFVFEPIEDFQVILNVRAGLILFVIAVTMLNYRITASFRNALPWLGQVLSALQIVVVAMTFAFITGETIDYFGQKIAAALAAGDELWRLTNLRQLSLSVVWLLFSVGLMGFGFWKSHRSFRIIAFVIFGFTIMKIFIYDLSYLETLYRIFSFIGLGAILLAVSYVYQKYKSIIFGTGENKGI